MDLVVLTVVAGALAGVAVALLGVVIIGDIVQRLRAKAEFRVDKMSLQVLQRGADLSAQTRVDGYTARVLLIRAASAAFAEQQSRAERHL